MIGRAVVLAAVLLLGACRPSEPVPAPLPADAALPLEEALTSDRPLPLAVETVAGATSEAVAAVQEVAATLLPDAPPPPPVEPLVAAAAVDLIVRWEVTSPSYYARRLAQPIWPGGASGITWCIGYDGGHQTSQVILEEWSTHPQRERLATTAGLTGSRAKSVLQQYRDITTGYQDCVVVFETRTLVEYERRTRRAFPHYERMRPLAKGALVSLVYNRGASMTGDSRREMKNIRDQCEVDYACIAAEIRSMTRLWKGSTIENGMNARREAEALLVERTQ